MNTEPNSQPNSQLMYHQATSVWGCQHMLSPTQAKCVCCSCKIYLQNILQMLAVPIRVDYPEACSGKQPLFGEVHAITYENACST
jgi:hypothetical protein